MKGQPFEVSDFYAQYGNLFKNMQVEAGRPPIPEIFTALERYVFGEQVDTKHETFG